METKVRSARISLILLSLFVILFVFFFYTFLHESGHALIGVMFGQSLTEFDISFWDLSAHVGMVGGALTSPQLAVQAMAGASLPLLVWGIFMFLVPRKTHFILELLKLTASMAVLNTLLAWIVIPALYVFEKAPLSDDVTNFLQYGGISPWLLSVITIIIYICGWFLFISRIDGLRNEVDLFRTTAHESIIAGIRTNVPVMTGIMIIGAIFAFLLNRSARANPLANTFSPPRGFAAVAEINLSSQTYSAEKLTEFTVDEVTNTGVFIAVRNINTSYFDLRVVGTDGYESVVMHGEGYRAERDSGLWEDTLPPGTYQLVLTSHQSPGTASVFFKTP